MKFAVKVHNEFLSRAIQELAFKNGCGWCDGAVYTDIVNKFYANGNGVLFFEDRFITHCSVSYAESHYSDYPLFDAKTDWGKIEQAMKPKVIWVSEFKNGLGAIHESEGLAKHFTSNPDYIRTIKFQEVI